MYCLDCNGYGYRFSVDNYEIDFVKRERGDNYKTTSEQTIIRNLNHEENVERLEEPVALFKKKFPNVMKKVGMKKKFDSL